MRKPCAFLPALHTKLRVSGSHLNIALAMISVTFSSLKEKKNCDFLCVYRMALPLLFKKYMQLLYRLEFFHPV